MSVVLDTMNLFYRLKFVDTVTLVEEAQGINGQHFNGVIKEIDNVAPLIPKESSCTRYNGVNDFTRALIASEPFYPLGDFTFSAWGFPESEGTRSIWGIMGADGSFNDELSMFVRANGLIRYRVHNIQMDAPIGSYTLNQWNHFVLRRTGSTVEAITNGVKLTVGTYAPALDFGCEMFIASDADTTCNSGIANVWQGNLQQFRLYNSSLSDFNTDRLNAGYNSDLDYADSVGMSESGEILLNDWRQSDPVLVNINEETVPFKFGDVLRNSPGSGNLLTDRQRVLLNDWRFSDPALAEVTLNRDNPFLLGDVIQEMLGDPPFSIVLLPEEIRLLDRWTCLDPGLNRVNTVTEPFRMGSYLDAMLKRP